MARKGNRDSRLQPNRGTEMSNEKANATTETLWRVNYQYPAKNFQLRAGALIISATDATEANKKAEAEIAKTGVSTYRLTSTKQY